MWFEKRQYDEVHSVLKRGVIHDIRRMLSEVFSFDRSDRENPGICPRCNKKLTRQMLPYLEAIVNACPDYHGFWMTRDVSLAIRKSLGEELAASTRKTELRKWMAVLAAFVLLLAAIASLPASFQKKYKDYFSSFGAAQIGRGNWPAADFSGLPSFPASVGAVMEDEDVYFYFYRWATWVRDAVTNRENAEAMLKSARRSPGYQQALEIYLERQGALLTDAENAVVPDTVKDFHSRWMAALKLQNLHYMQAFKNKADDPRSTQENPGVGSFASRRSGEIRRAAAAAQKLEIPEAAPLLEFIMPWLSRFSGEV